MPLKEWNAYVYVLYDETQGKKIKTNPVIKSCKCAWSETDTDVDGTFKMAWYILTNQKSELK